MPHTVVTPDANSASARLSTQLNESARHAMIAQHRAQRRFSRLRHSHPPGPPNK